MVGEDFNDNKTYKRTGLIISLGLHAIIVAFILFYPSLTYDFPPAGKEGILVIFGDDPESSGDELNNDSQTKSKENEKKNQPKEEKKSEKKIEKKVDSKKPEKFEKDLVEDNDNPTFDSKKSNTESKQHQVPEKTIADAKNEFGKLFNSRGTKSKRNGVQGDPLGSRDSKILEGITRGKGEVGEGLDSRGILYEPNFEDSSQKSGRVVVKVCVNETGNVVSSKYTQRGSTTHDLELITIAERNAKKYRFAPSNKKEQCGTITIDFIVK